MNLQLVNTEETITRLLALIRDAKEKVTLVSPYFDLGTDDRVGRAIRDALLRKVRVVIFVREDKWTTIKPAWLEAMRPQLEAGLQLFAVGGLHAKAYLSESTVLLTSLNLLRSSFLNSIELGLWSQDPASVKEVREFLIREIQFAKRVSLDDERSAPARPASSAGSGSRPTKKAAQGGFCIRCAEPVPLNPDRPYCPGCFDAWSEWENEDYKDEFCHGCGDEHPATMAKPLCRDCFKSVA